MILEHECCFPFCHTKKPVVNAAMKRVKKTKKKKKGKKKGEEAGKKDKKGPGSKALAAMKEHLQKIKVMNLF